MYTETYPAPRADGEALRASVVALAAARPLVVDVRPAREVVAGLEEGAACHAGPPIAPQRMCAPMRAALGAALALEGVAPMAGIVTSSMPVWVAVDEATGRMAWCPLNEGSGRVLRYGADGPEVLERLAWMRDTLAPALAGALRDVGPLDLISLQDSALRAGDECHHRTDVGSGLVARALAPGLECSPPEVLRFALENDQFFLNLAMVGAKLALDCAAGMPGSSLVSAIARNGVEVGVRLSGTGSRWFTGPAALPEPAALYPGHDPREMCPDLGDSAIVETYGLGALAVAAAPAAGASVGLDPATAAAGTERLRAIAAGAHPLLRVPAAGCGEAPAILGIDARAVVREGLAPPIHTGIAHREPGVGQIGGGVTHPPLAAFAAALAALDGRSTAAARASDRRSDDAPGPRA